MQLLKITSTPIEYEIKIEHAELKKAETEMAQLKIKTQQAQMKINNAEMRRNLNMRNNDEFVRQNATNGVQNAMQKTSEYAQLGKQLSQIHNGTNVSDIFRNKMLNEAVAAAQQTPQYVQLGNPDITWTPPKIDLSYIKGVDSEPWQTNKSNMEYVPGRFHMDIIQLPKVSIEYLGGAVYVPKSSDPNYEAKE